MKWILGLVFYFVLVCSGSTVASCLEGFASLTGTGVPRYSRQGSLKLSLGVCSSVLG